MAKRKPSRWVTAKVWQRESAGKEGVFLYAVSLDGSRFARRLRVGGTPGALGYGWLGRFVGKVVRMKLALDEQKREEFVEEILLDRSNIKEDLSAWFAEGKNTSSFHDN